VRITVNEIAVKHMINTNDLALFGRIATAAGLGFSIGWEREVRGHPAGARTFALVCTAAAALTALSVSNFPSTADRLISGLISGVGFLGAGIVLRNADGRVQGLTTAAAIWAVTTLGVIVGTGRYALGLLLSVLYIIILELPSIPLLSRLDARKMQRWFKQEPQQRDDQ
jgi:putative Mg2+ transporter-C (MgtC) family protein